MSAHTRECVAVVECGVSIHGLLCSLARLSAHEEQNKIDKLELSVSSLSFSPRVRAQVVAVREDVNDAGIVL